MLTSDFRFQYLLHVLVEIAAACGAVYWISRAWNRVPAPAPVRVAQHPKKILVACGLAIIPPLFGLFLWKLVFWGMPLQNSILVTVLFFVLSLAYGAIFGLAASCCAGTKARLRVPAAYIVAVLLVLVPSWVSLLGTFFLVMVVVIAFLILETGGPKPVFPPADGSTPPPLPHQSSPLTALLLGFAPTVFVLLAVSFGAAGVGDHMSNDTARILLVLASVASVVCCIISSIMLFKRKTSAAIAGAIMLLLLNLFLSFFFGCCALMVGASFH